MIKLLILDVDGTLTDGRVYYSKDGEELQAFDRRDGHGIMMAKKAGIEVIWVTGHLTDPARQRAKHLDCDAVESHDKHETVAALMRNRLLDANEVAYVGDDLPDYACRDLVSYFYAPFDHVLSFELNYVTLERKGGHGAVREAIDLILEENRCRASVSS